MYVSINICSFSSSSSYRKNGGSALNRILSIVPVAQFDSLAYTVKMKDKRYSFNRTGLFQILFQNIESHFWKIPLTIYVPTLQIAHNRNKHSFMTINKNFRCREKNTRLKHEPISQTNETKLNRFEFPHQLFITYDEKEVLEK